MSLSGPAGRGFDSRHLHYYPHIGNRTTSKAGSILWSFRFRKLKNQSQRLWFNHTPNYSPKERESNKPAKLVRFSGVFVFENSKTRVKDSGSTTLQIIIPIKGIEQTSEAGSILWSFRFRKLKNQSQRLWFCHPPLILQM
jgi:hypothetical protein